MNLTLTYGKLRDLSARLLVDIKEAEQKSGNITLTLNNFHEAVL